MSARPDCCGEALAGVGGGGATLPDTPTAVLEQAIAANSLVGLDALGVGEAIPYASVRALLGAPAPSWMPLSGTVFTVAALAGGAFPAGINAIGGSPLAIDPASYAIDGLTTAFTLCVTGYTDNASRTGTVTLWDLTTNAAVATVTFNNAGPTAAAASATATLNATPHVYEVRLSVSGTLTTHLATVNNVSLRITWS